MEKEIKFCSFKEHKDIEAINFCFKCQVYLCNKCLNYHKGLFESHPVSNLDKENDETFIGFCQEVNHNIKTDYFCKSHNQLCCAICLCKIKGNGNGQHNDCDICFINDIKEEKRRKLKDNIKTLEELSNKLEQSIINLKIIFQKVNKSKENIKLEIQKIFTKIRTELNDREDILLLEVDKYFENNYCNEEIIKKSEKLPKKIKASLEKGKAIDNEWKDGEKLNMLINDCINIENNLVEINFINKIINKFNKDNKINFQFNADTDKFINRLKKFGCFSCFESIILKNYDDFNKFNILINNGKTINNLNLLYRSSRDGFNYLNIVNRINNKSNLVFLYLTGNDRIFGAYIKTKLENIDLNGSRKYYKDENAFVFSVNNNNKKYKIVVPQNAIAFDKENIILVGNNGNNNGFCHSKDIVFDKDLINVAKIFNFSKNNEMTEGSNKFKELEIFEINSN